MPRHLWDRYDTPQLAIQTLMDTYPFIQGESLLDPCAGDGRITDLFRAARRFHSSRTNDLDPNTPAEEHLDARDPGLYQQRPCWIVTNPPFRLASDIAQTALQHSNVGVALLLRCTFLEPCQNRYWLQMYPPTHLLSLPRLSFTKNTKTDFVPTWWFVWVHGKQGTIKVVVHSPRKAQQLPFSLLSSYEGGNISSERFYPPEAKKNFSG